METSGEPVLPGLSSVSFQITSHALGELVLALAPAQGPSVASFEL